MPLLKFVVRDVTLEIEQRFLNTPLQAALEGGRYEGAEADAIQKLLRPDDVYFELGGGAGFLSTLAWRVLRDKSRIHVYEANPAMMTVINRTWKANGVEGNAYHCMLGAGPREAREFNVSKAFWASSADIAYAWGNTTITVPQRDFLQQLDRRAATFVMMDIEGGEKDLLDKTLSPKVRVVVAEYHPTIVGQETVDALWRHLRAQGFEERADASRGMVRAFVRET